MQGIKEQLPLWKNAKGFFKNREGMLRFKCFVDIDVRMSTFPDFMYLKATFSFLVFSSVMST